MLVGYAPGAIPAELPKGHAIHVPAGWEMLFELHYTPNGSPQEDLSDIGLSFIDQADVTQIVKSEAIANQKLKIKANDPAAIVTAERTLEAPVDVVSMSPHMHVRGKSFRFEAFYPDGKHEVLLDVPEYDFNWQLTYELDEVKRMPAGTRILCTALFDNSADNPNNPDPNKDIKWGQQSWDEMMIGFFQVMETPRGLRPVVTDE